MKIETYDFGRITISGNSFTSDVIIFPERVLSPWWRKEGHYLQLVDMKEIINYKPEVLVIGTGYSGQMRVAPEVDAKLRELNIEYHIVDSRKGTELFNSIESVRKVGAFHLTC